MRVNKHGTSKVLLGVAVLILLNFNLSGFLYYNDVDIIFGEGLKKGTVIKEHVIRGAGYFLESYSDFLLFLTKIEVSELDGLDYDKLRLNLNNAIEKMEYARDTYIQLKEEADVTPYNPIMIEELLNFDYDGFQKKNHLIESIFDDVSFYLSKGKIREMYEKTISHIEGILEIANGLNEAINAGKFPKVSTLQDLNETCSKSLLFGQYAAKVFKKIK